MSEINKNIIKTNFPQFSCIIYYYYTDHHEGIRNMPQIRLCTKYHNIYTYILIIILYCIDGNYVS